MPRAGDEPDHVRDIFLAACAVRRQVSVRVQFHAPPEGGVVAVLCSADDSCQTMKFVLQYHGMPSETLERASRNGPLVNRELALGHVAAT